jgi:hypothetical protein
VAFRRINIYICNGFLTTSKYLTFLPTDYIQTGTQAQRSSSSPSSLAALPCPKINGNRPKKWFLPTNQNLSQSQTTYSFSTTTSTSLYHPIRPFPPPLLHHPHHHHLPHYPLNCPVSDLLSSHRPDLLSFIISQEPLLFKQ